MHLINNFNTFEKGKELSATQLKKKSQQPEKNIHDFSESYVQSINNPFELSSKDSFNLKREETPLLNVCPSFFPTLIKNVGIKKQKKEIWDVYCNIPKCL